MCVAFRDRQVQKLTALLLQVGGKLMRQRMEQTAAGTDRAQHKE